jgi:hypothetical protein
MASTSSQRFATRHATITDGTSQVDFTQIQQLAQVIRDRKLHADLKIVTQIYSPSLLVSRLWSSYQANITGFTVHTAVHGPLFVRCLATE